MTRWVSPDSSKKRSNTMVDRVGSSPSAEWAVPRYSSTWATAEGARFKPFNQRSALSESPLQEKRFRWVFAQYVVGKAGGVDDGL